MSYPTKVHTRLNSTEFFQHVFSLYPSNVSGILVTALNDIGIDNLFDFLGETYEYYEDLKYKDRVLNKKGQRILRQVYNWLRWETANRPGIDFGQLTTDDCDKYLTSKATEG